MMEYIIQSGLVWLCLLLFYRFFLLRITFYELNRFYLLASLVLGACFPYLIKHINYSVSEPALKSISVVLPVINFSESMKVSTNVESSFLWIYFIGLLVVSIRFIIGLIKIFLLKRSGKVEVIEGYKVIITNTDHLPFSFMNWVFVNKEVTNDNFSEILKHETIHINQKHSIDVLLCEIIHSIFWFNPLLVLFKKYIRQNHEYIADDATIQKVEKENYIELLLSQSGYSFQPSLSNQFFTSQIKNRITMLLSKKTNQSRLVIYALVIPLVIGIGLLFSAFNYNNTLQSSKTIGEIDEMPRFPGCENVQDTKERESCANMKMFEFFAKHMKYPEEAKKKNVEGMCVAKFTVNKNGKMEDITILKHVGSGTDKATLDIMNKMKKEIKWIPARDKGKTVDADMTIPVKFKLS